MLGRDREDGVVARALVELGGQQVGHAQRPVLREQPAGVRGLQAGRQHEVDLVAPQARELAPGGGQVRRAARRAPGRVHQHHLAAAEALQRGLGVVLLVGPWTEGGVDLTGAAAILLDGSAKSEVLVGSAGGNEIVGGGGCDRIEGRGGDDVLLTDPRFQELHAKKSLFLWGLMAFSVVYYFALPLGADYLTDVFRIKVWGPVNVGLLFALLLRRADRREGGALERPQGKAA